MPEPLAARAPVAEIIRLFDVAPAPQLDTSSSAPIPYAGQYRMRGRWLTDPYARLRNAAWAVRNSRVGAGFNPLALRLMLAESERLMAAGETLGDVLEAYAELLLKP